MTTPGTDPVLTIILRETVAVSQRRAIAQVAMSTTVVFIAAALLERVQPFAGLLTAVLTPVCLVHLAWLRANVQVRAVKKDFDKLPLWERHQVNLALGRVGGES